MQRMLALQPASSLSPEGLLPGWQAVVALQDSCHLGEGSLGLVQETEYGDRDDDIEAE